MKPLYAGIAAATLALTAGTAAAVVAGTAVAAPPTCQTLFDDFSYSNSSDSLINQHGWSVRTNSGGPGIPGASWPASNISFPTVDGAKSLQLQAATDGTAGGTSQAEFLSSQLRFFEGTYAARVKFADAPVSGTDGDHLVETFFTITPLNAPMDPNYGEIDFEYLPNGGWGEPSNIFYETTWETYRPDPWEAVNTHGEQRQSYNGWHDLLFTVSAGHVKYYVDGALVADHSGIYYPETPMSVNFNLWFIDSAAHSGGTATYRQQVDYFLHTVGEVLTPAQASARVNGYRAAGTNFSDTMAGGGSCPTASPTASQSSSPTPTPSQTGGAGCANSPLWNHSSVYLGGAKVKWERSKWGDPAGPKSGDGVHLWRARWWTQGSEPGWTQQWEDLGRC